MPFRQIIYFITELKKLNLMPGLSWSDEFRRIAILVFVKSRNSFLKIEFCGQPKPWDSARFFIFSRACSYSSFDPDPMAYFMQIAFCETETNKFDATI